MAAVATPRTYPQTLTWDSRVPGLSQVPIGFSRVSATMRYFVWSPLRPNACPSLRATPVLARFQCCLGAHCFIQDEYPSAELRCHQILPVPRAVGPPDADGVPDTRGSDTPIVRRDDGHELACVCLRLLQHDMAWPRRYPTDRCTIPAPRCISFRDMSLSRQCWTKPAAGSLLVTDSICEEFTAIRRLDCNDDATLNQMAGLSISMSFWKKAASGSQRSMGTKLPADRFKVQASLPSPASRIG